MSVMQPEDGVEESLARSVREATQTAERAGATLSGAIRLLRRRMEAGKENQRRRAALRAAYDTAWHEAREKLSVVRDPDWWDKATPAQIGDVYEVAVTWREHEKEARKLDNLIHKEVLDRYGHDLRTPSRAQVEHDLEQVMDSRTDPEHTSERDQDGKPVEPDQNGPVPETERESSEAAPGSPEQQEERREQMRSEMRSAGIDPELIEHRLRVHDMNPQPPQDAVQRRKSQTQMRARAQFRQQRQTGVER